MAINWFEGGRRISKLLMVVVAGVGAIAVLTTSDAQPTFFTEGPDEPWVLRNSSCEHPAYSRYLSDVDTGGKRQTVVLCFEASSNGKTPYAVAPEPEDAARERKAREAQQEAEDKARMARGEPPPLRLSRTPSWYYTGDPYFGPASDYINARAGSFRLTPEMAKEVRSTAGSRQVSAWSQAFSSAGPWVFGAIAFIWILTAVIGWIARGFAGIPTGSDFRQQRAEP